MNAVISTAQVQTSLKQYSPQIEAVLWDVTNPYAFLAGTAGGDVFCVDIR